MPNKKLNCKDGLKKQIIKKNIFEQEIALCQELSKKNNGKCGWGKCKNCGVLFLLHKVYKDELIEDKNKVEKIRKDILGI